MPSGCVEGLDSLWLEAAVLSTSISWTEGVWGLGSQSCVFQKGPWSFLCSVNGGGGEVTSHPYQALIIVSNLDLLKIAHLPDTCWASQLLT